MAREPSEVAALRRSLGERLALFRSAAGLTQQELGALVFRNRTTIAHIERGGRRADEEFWTVVDDVTNADGTLLATFGELQAARAAHESAVRDQVVSRARELVSRQHPAGAPTDHPRDVAPTEPAQSPLADSTWTPDRGNDDDVKRTEFVAGLIATLAAPPGVFGTSRIGPGDVSRYRRQLEQLYTLDDSYGASGEVYTLTIRTLRTLMQDVNNASYLPAVGHRVRTLIGQLMEHAGWLAFDAGHTAHARYWWLEALNAARMADDGRDVEVVVLASMSAQASRVGRGREAVDLARAAQRQARALQSPRLMSLLLAREALGHARCADHREARRAITNAHNTLNGERPDLDPPWLNFWDGADLSSHEATAAGYLGNAKGAETAARTALALADSDRYPRNHAFYTTRLARILATTGNVDEAVPLAADAAMKAYDLHSHRLTNDVRDTMNALAVHRDHTAAQALVRHLNDTYLSGRA